MGKAKGILARNIYPSCEKICEGPIFNFITHFAPQTKLIIFHNERDNLSPGRFEWKFAKHVTEDVKVI
jgi:hypothetical protein